MTLLRTESQKAKLAIALLLVTMLAIGFQSFGLRKTLVIDADTHFPFQATDDRFLSGKSEAEVNIVHNAFHLTCNIKESDFLWKYCELSFDLSSDETGAGLDLSRYNAVKIWVRYDKPSGVGVRFQTRNYDTLYSNDKDPRSMKYNIVEVYRGHLQYPIEIPFEYLSVPTWWLEEHELPLEKSHVEFDDTRSIVIVTGSGIQPGEYTLIVERIEIIGKYFSDDKLYLFLVLMWVSSALFFVADRLKFIKQELKVSRRRQRELESLVRLLNVKKHVLEEKLSRDPLTGALNREGVAKVFEGRESQPGQELSIVFIDVDHFKEVNDTYGHILGDKVLKKFVEVLTENTREVDVLSRWGGEEFLLACPNTQLQFATQLAEKLRACVEAYKWPNNIRLTASFGVAQMLDELPSEFIERADAALYSAKKQGRNRVVVAEGQQ